MKGFNEIGRYQNGVAVHAEQLEFNGVALAAVRLLATCSRSVCEKSWQLVAERQIGMGTTQVDSSRSHS